MRQAGWRVLNLESVDPGASVYLDTTAQLIGAANAVIVVLTKRHTPNALLEAGLAIGLRRPVLLIAKDAAIMDGLGPDRILGSLPRVKAKLSDRDALRFHVGAFLDGVMSSPTAKPLDWNVPRTALESTKGPASRTVEQISDLEGRLLRALEQAVEIEAVHLEPRLGGSRRFQPDFAVWLNDSSHSIPNLLIVELIGSEAVRRGWSDRRLDQLYTYAYDTGVGAVMLVEDAEAQPLSLERLNPMSFRVGLAALEALLSEKRLVPEMIRARNRLAHSAG